MCHFLIDPLRLGMLALTASAMLCATPAAAHARKKHPPPADAAASAPTYAARADAIAFAREAAAQQGLDADWAAAQVAQARYQSAVARLIMPPKAGTAKNWRAYRARFVEPQRIEAGLRWWQLNEAWLAQAEARWGVPAQIIVAIVGVETFYGRIRGHFKVIDALSTLAFDFPPGRKDRSAFFRSELAAFLLWCAATGRDAQSVQGSYAGAIGLAQFMPSSIAKYAVDFDADGRIDLDDSAADAIGSIAAYFAANGWQSGVATHFGVAEPVDTTHRATLLAPDILPTFSAQQMQDLGAVLDEAGRTYSGELALVELQNGDLAPEYVAGTRNFYAVTRYNWSSYYALAVIELAEALRQQHTALPAAPAAAPTAAPTASTVLQ